MNGQTRSAKTFTAPAGSTGLQWSVAAKAAGAEGDKADRLKARQKVVPAVPVRVLQATLAQIDKELSTTVALPAEAIPGRGEVAVQLQARLGSDLPGVRDWMERYPYSCLEQRVSKAVALRDEAAWRSIMSALPAYIDHDGLLKYFAGMGQGSDSLTAYVMAIAHEAQWSIPESILPRLQAGLGGFVNGTVVRHGSLPTADLAIRKVAALEALSRYGADLGLAFQIQDDVLDVLGETATLGKIAGADAARGKPTYPSILGLAESQRLARLYCDRAIGSLAGLGPGAAPLAQLADYVVNRSH
mgnify:CR=1 FL=1